MERVKGIEPSSTGWKPGTLPLSYTRPILYCANYIYPAGINVNKYLTLFILRDKLFIRHKLKSITHINSKSHNIILIGINVN
jgi:hypothetical protein